MTFDLLTLPFIGGYVFYTRFSLTSYSAVRAVGHHLLLRSALTGFVLLILARLLIMAAPEVEKHSDQFLSGAMSTVPALAFAGAIALFECLWADSKRRLSNLMRSPKGIAIFLECVALAVISVETACAAPSYQVWMASGAGALLVGVWLASLITVHTGIRFRLSSFRVCWFLLILVLAVAVSAEYADDVARSWTQFSTIKDSGAPTIALLLGVLSWYPLNLLVPYTYALERFHRQEQSDAMDRFLFYAAETNELIQLSMSDSKFYIGTVYSLAANPLAPNSFVRIIPYASGYRDKDTKELRFTSFYDSIYSELEKEPDFHVERFAKVLPFSAIQSASRFDPEIYMKFQQENGEQNGSVLGNEIGDG